MSLFTELKRRNVFRVGIAYVLMGWVVLQGVDFALDLIDAPNWVIQALSIVAIAGLPIALFFAWAFEVTPEGIKREADVDRTTSITPQTGRKLDRTIIVFLAIALVLVLGERFFVTGDRQPATETSIANSEETPAAKSIAVLPFVNMSADADNEYFSDGVAEEILNVLADIEDLDVAARTSAFRYKGSDKSIDEIAAELRVTHVLEGSVRKAGDQVRITAQLIQANNGFHMWSETYDRELTNIFEVQDEIAGNIAQVLEVHLLGEQKAYATVNDLSPEAYEKFLRARYLLRRRNEVDIAKASELSEAVIAETPDFPRGLMQLAESLIQGPARSQVTAQVIELTNSALALDPDLAAGHMMLGIIEQDADNPLGAIRQLQKAIELDPSEPRPYHWLGINLANAGFLGEARVQLQTAVDMEPDHANANGYLGYVFLLLGEFDTAAYHFKEQVRHGNEYGSERLVHVAALKGDLDAARRTLTEVDGISRQDFERVGRFLDAMEDPGQLENYLELLPVQEDYDWHIVMEHYLLGEIDRAYELQVRWDQPPREAWADFWAGARNYPQFMPLIQVNNLDDVWDELGPPPACRKVESGYDCTPEAQP